MATIDGTDNGANGADLLITFTALADTAAVKAVMEHLAFASTDLAANIVNQDRGIGFVLTDPDGNQTEPDSIYVQLQNITAPTGLAVDDWGDPENQTDQTDDRTPFSEIGLLNTPQVLDADIDFDDFAGTSFDGGFVRVDEVYSGSASVQLSVQDQGTGAGQIGFDGTNVSFGGTVIGTVNGTSNGVNSAALQIDLNASATAESVEALAEAFTVGLSGGYNTTSMGFDLTVQNQAGNTSNFVRFDIPVLRDLVVVNSAQTPEEQVNSFTTDDQTSPRVAELSDGRLCDHLDVRESGQSRRFPARHLCPTLQRSGPAGRGRVSGQRYCAERSGAAARGGAG